MKLSTLLCCLLIFVFNPAMALPDLSLPNDILTISNNVIEILNTGDSSILECSLIFGKLRSCETKYIDGLVLPYRAASDGKIGVPSTVYITEAGYDGLFRFQTNEFGVITPTSTVVKIPNFLDTGKILDLRRSKASSLDNFNSNPRFIVSQSLDDSSNQYGQLFNFKMEGGVPVSYSYPKVYLPAFSLESGDSAHSETLIGAGAFKNVSSETSPRYPFSALLEGNSGELSDNSQEIVKTPLAPDVASVAQFDGKYWVTYKSPKKFTRFDSFPSDEATNPDSYDAPSDANVRLKKIQTRLGDRDFSNNFALFFNDNKIGVCTGGDSFHCEDAFMYLSAFARDYNNKLQYLTSLSLNHLADHGSVFFENQNNSPINANEINNDIDIPESLKAAFTGSCVNKVDFSAGNADANEYCVLSYDFRKLTNTSAINESFDVGFTVHGPFGDVPTHFHFNVDLPVPPSHLQFENAGNVISELNLNAGDSGSIDVAYISASNDTFLPKISFLNGSDNSSLLRSYFADTGCLSSNAIPLHDGGHCTLAYHIPADANSAHYTLSLNNPDSLPTDESTLSLLLSSRGNVIAHSPYGNQDIEHLEGYHELDIEPGESETIRFTNVGAATVHNFNLVFPQPQQQHVPITLNGTCMGEGVNLDALGGYCDLVINLNSSASSIVGRFALHVSGDDVDSYVLPLVLGELPPEQGLAVVDSNTETIGDLELNQMIKGHLTVTNYTGHDISSLYTYYPYYTNYGIFHSPPDSNGIPGCVLPHTTPGDQSIKLDKLSSCRIDYQVKTGLYVPIQHSNVKFAYTEAGESEVKYQNRFVYFTNQPAIRVSELGGDSSLQSVNLDASQPQTEVLFSNELDYPVTNFSVEVDPKLDSIISKNTCNFKSLDSGSSCSVGFELDDTHPLIANNYSINIKGDNLFTRIVPLSIKKAQTDNVEIDNRGGYSMSVNYVGYYSEDTGNCKLEDCYDNKSTGWFTNPFNTYITGVSGRNLTMYMMLGTSVSLPSCDGGKIICTGTTLNPECHYYGDGTKNGSPQNQCLRFNH
ncbi:hypothetical protein D5018_08765 [Parashewanella curva]|uniref:Choice-of-anchor D domain-containing protein n=1 Tax=Parashewanella curva TaxID=2338552 RepID=A0A3L8PXQ0_9GAMM|nr:hypothetical protein [Parashewanella curva]RLV60100.1 hypothetical protein D5018_08765 [Parashewanella curva]